MAARLGHQVNSTEVVKSVWRVSTGSSQDSYCANAFNWRSLRTRNMAETVASHGAGNVFTLTPSAGGWTYSDLYDFTRGSDGGNSLGSLVLDANGNLSGTTEGGGSNGDGVIFEIIP